ncbi:MAG: UDP-N-acetylmuramate dehydrogenase [Bacteroidales bacterium]|jgi:UDP-N-acetylmuramate dehydrogenase|nr:UDP-N-acetylmuramate dehydrogenase [Bacteroidales bacterium]
MKIFENISLLEYNTFGIDVQAKRLICIENEDSLPAILQQYSRVGEDIILGGGSNVLFSKDFEGTIWQLQTKGIEIVEKTDNKVKIKVKAGEKWDNFVQFCLRNGYYGLENLAGIPGQVGSTPVQNIGAYGVEVKEFIAEVHAFSFFRKKRCIFAKNECDFDYRSSIFKKKYRNELLITDVVFELSLFFTPNLTYSDVAKTLENEKNITPQLLYDTVLNIRNSKLPDYHLVGNAGSFFKNPILPKKDVLRLLEIYPDLKMYNLDNQYVKLSCAQLIEATGWKGVQRGNVGVDKKQALILVNYGAASPNEILELAKDIQNAVYQQFKVKIEPEVNII